MAGWATRIAARWQESVEAIIGTGRLLAEAKEELPHGAFRSMIDSALPFGARTAQRLMHIAADPRLSNATHVSHLPPAWGTLYELTRLDDDAFQARLADGTIKPDMERRDIAQFIKATVRQTRMLTLSGKQAALEGQFGVIYSDPPWAYKAYSDATGMDRAADNHYPTMGTPEICALDVPKTAAPDCVLWLWATVPMLPDAFQVMSAWGFQYASHCIWNKVGRFGTGHWFRNKHELLLVGVKGKIPGPLPGSQALSVIDAPVGAHSEKPHIFRAIIEGLFAELPKTEMFARKRHPGWTPWGNQVPPIVSDDAPRSKADKREAKLLAAHHADTNDMAPPASILKEPDDALGIPDFLRRRG